MFSPSSTTSKQQLMHPFDTSQELRQNMPVNNNNNNNNMSNNNNNNNAARSNNPPPSSWMMNHHGPEHMNYMMHQRPPVMGPLPPNGTPPPSRQMQHTFSSAGSSPALEEKNSKGNNRPVIPSKRAAQNRAAQKAFRQRREHYIKELEDKAKKMDDWQDEMDTLKKENVDLREKVTSLEKKVAMLKRRLSGIDGEIVEEEDEDESVKQEMVAIEEHEGREEEGLMRRESESLSVSSSNASKVLGSLERSDSISRPQEIENSSPRFEPPQPQQSSPYNTSPRTALNITITTPSTANNQSNTIADADVTHTSPQQHNAIREIEPTSTLLPMQQTNPIGQAPMNISPVNFTAHVSNMAPIPMNISDPMLLSQQQQQQQQQSDYWMQQQQQGGGGGGGDIMNDLDFDFDPFFEEDFGPTLGNDFLPSANSGQVLDDLFAMLQTRQRPQIPMVPTDEKEVDDNNRIND